ncbi:hypothetical protein ASU33_08055 [Solirubrum puertoriconensis]|uniref:Biopolymer transporter Tol n=1 Tax=Solirubrum puertoriconensis TaxID=1751427 RepID=A0A9X0HLH7_SOLP1|nr:hypothetical protein [Solirubrum puertoriconensis]KUG08139.1 hypothetical protein ASU33_08055 [Solirubrum puertoriconensis]
MLRFPSFAACVFAVAATFSASAQSLPILDQNPPSLRWRQVRTPHFSVLYPQGFDSAAQRTARRLEQVHAVGSATLGVTARPLTVVLQNQTTVNNGFVTFLPRHSEFFVVPPQDMSLGTLDWLDQLAVHEFRHVGQFDKARQGVGRLLVPLLGDGALGVSSVGVPPWFFEGDAVGTETALTRSGRGRIPNFDVGMRANLLSGRYYSYTKAVGGSYRDLVPDWYVLGYFMTSYLKKHHGPDVWDRVLDRYYSFPFYPFSFSRSIRRETGLRVEQLYQRSMLEAEAAWRDQQRELVLTDGRELKVQATEKVFTQYEFPQYLSDSTVLALKTGLGDIAQLVRLSKQGREEKVFVLGQLHWPEMLSVAAGKAIWPEYGFDPRWGQRIYTELRVLDLGTGQLTRLTQGSRYTAAALSPDGTRIVATQTDESYRHSLVLLDAATGKVLQTLPNPQNQLYIQPRFTPDGQQVVAVVLRPEGKTIELINPATNQVRALLPVANVNLSNPQPWGDYVLYNSPQSGLDNVHAVHTGTGRTYQVTSRPFGAYHAAVSPDGRRLTFHDYRAQGARVMEMPLEPATWREVPVATADPARLYSAQLAAQEPGARRLLPQLAAPADSGQAYAVRPYSPLRHAFNVFGWGLVQSPAGNSLSLGIRSQDFLNTTQAIAGVSFDQAERTAGFFGGVSYQGRYPVFDLDIEHGGRNAGILYQGDVYRDRWRYTRLSTGLRLPLMLTRSKYLQALTLGAYYLHEQVRDYNLPVRRITEVGPNSPLNGVQGSVSYARVLKQSTRDVGPRWGQSLLATGRTTPFGRGLEASQWAVQGSVYFPGVGKHHNIRVRGGYQWQQQREYQFAPAVFFPRGLGYVSFDRLRTASIEYRLPLADTHWALGRWLYVQRFTGSGFADWAHGRNVEGRFVGSRTYQNLGLSATVVFNVLRLRTPIETGLRYVYDTRTGNWVLQPLVLDIGI